MPIRTNDSANGGGPDDEGVSRPGGEPSPPSSGGSGDGVEVYDLSPRVPALRLEPGGFRLIQRAGRSYHPLVLYGDVTHVASTERGFWLATVRGLFFARRSRFRDPGGPERLAQEVVRRIASSPGGLRQLETMAEVDHLARHPRPVRATWVVAALCCVVYALQLGDPFVEHIAAFDPLLAAGGEWWRLVTANFVHGTMSIPFHIGLNLLGLVGFGFLVERALGPARVACVLAASGLCAMGASGLLRSDQVIGASGMVAGLAGSALCLELLWARRLPAWWRLPRRPFIALLALQVVIDHVVPRIAGEAHLGGFAAGFAVTLATGGSALQRQAAGTATRLAAVAAAGLGVASFAVATPLWLRDPAALEHHGQLLLDTPGVSPVQDNHLAWVMATESDASREQLQVAVELAERAVQRTDHRDPDILDTLAETLFVTGQVEGALAVIDEAIALAPTESYFWEQRRRFAGERAKEDRPSPPTVPWFFRETPPPAPLPLPEIEPEPAPPPDDSAEV